MPTNRAHGQEQTTRMAGKVARKHPADAHDAQEMPAHPFLELQRQIGNAQVARMLAQRVAEEERDMPEIGLAGGPVSDRIAARIQSRRGSGAALSTPIRSQMEGAFGTSLADVRLHTDGEAQSLNRKLSAKAFTTGNDIYFGTGASPRDTNLVAHELTHVVQQRGMSSGGQLTVGAAGDRYEQEAEAVASTINRMPIAQPQPEEAE